MKKKRLTRKQSVGQKSWITFIVLFFIVILLSLFVYKINSSIVFNSRAGGCFCGDLKCFNGNNFSKAYVDSGSNGSPQCCFGWPTGTLKNVKKDTCIQIGTPTIAMGLGYGSENNNPTVTPVSVDASNNPPIANDPVTPPITINTGCQLFNCNDDDLGFGLRSTKTVKRKIVNGITNYYRDVIGTNNDCNENSRLTNVVDYCSYSCKLGFYGYGACANTSVWQKINENYNPNPNEDQIKILGYYTDSTCTKKHTCNITPTPIYSPTPTVTGKKIILTNSSSFNLVIIWGWITKYTDSTRTVALSKFFNNRLTNSMFSDIGTFYSNSSRSIDLTNVDICKPDQQYPNASYWVDLQYQRSDYSGFMSIFNWKPAKSISIKVPCEQSGFVIKSDMTY